MRRRRGGVGVRGAWGLVWLLMAGSAAARAQSVGQRLAADLAWPQPLRDHRFGHMDEVFPVHRVRRGGAVRRLNAGEPLGLAPDLVERYMEGEHLAAVVVVERGRVRMERYGLGADAGTRWTGFSMTKAVTDSLVGAALRSGAVHSLEDRVAQYLPEMGGSAYEAVTVRQLMTMTSGVRWHENYTTPDADNVRLYTVPVRPGENSTVAYMRTLPRESAAGTHWNYSTGETDLLGVLLRRATGRTLAAELSSAIWERAGMERDGTWIATARGDDGEEFGGSGMSATARDWARLGQWYLEGGQATLPAGWMTEAAQGQVQAGQASYGYGWWPQEGGAYAALGVFGQSMLIDPARQLVVVTLGDWKEATGRDHSAARGAFWKAVEEAVDREGE